MSENRPPEGRRQKHNKPMIPGKGVTPRNPNVLANVDGMRVMRKILFQSPTSAPQWELNMLMAMHAAKQLGVQHFELAMEGSPVRPPVAAPNQYFVTYSIGGDEWRSGKDKDCTVSLYAHVVE